MTDHPVEDWNGEVGERWLKHLDTFESMISPINTALMRALALKPGQSVVEVGCGGGKNAVEAAKAVSPGGDYTGVDISQVLIDHCTKRAADLKNASFLCADAQTATLDTQRDRAFSSFGVMFFDHPPTAFANIRKWVKPGGDFVFSCWAAPELNPWIGIVASVMSKYVEPEERAPDGPGPFRMADPDATKALLEGAGWRDVELDLWKGEQLLGGEGATPESAAAFVLDGLGVAAPLQEAGGDVLQKAQADFVEAIKPFVKDGAIRMGAASWIVKAKA